MSTLTAPPLPPGDASPEWQLALRQAPAAARSVLRLLRRLRHGHLELRIPNGTVLAFGQPPTTTTLHARLELADWRVAGAVLRSGDIGFAESYLEGQWSSPDVAALLRLMLANRRELDAVVHGHWLGRALYRLRHRLRRNSRRGSRRNIHAHYDLGNGFYRLWLDESMTYSSAWFGGDWGQSLEQAQRAKMRRALQQTGVRAGQRLLEIGCGWGALAELAAREFGARVTGVTLSTEQLTHGMRRIAHTGLSEQVELRLQDYRDIADGPFDAIVSIEMIEAVGQAYWPAYFGALRRLLTPGGRACVQAIVIRDELFERYLQGTDFIQQYVFPGGCLLSRGEMARQARRAQLQIVDEFAFGPDYAETLRRWRRAFLAQRDAVLAQGFDERFVRLWTFYLAYCEAGFDAGDLDVVQVTLARP
ncbi:MAG: cyclopropane-fatty-acyl-phospholipid synthase family protein [Tepidimonas sp.]|uniref:cyclopropane-fatty-acyl-phospholipid synthase family protein n=1 Tax=Tepidimonas sp. TaxID=2002775 RepID=UPI00298F34C2|nr:cyclopropane-fatty-acyl-phospholipid synthase family protein [Tepidimonas sp.]MDW8336104.1 cyclopropane-fatty-acyl-phospholipid synthase family protein [Tepidimonas sp.]